MIESQGHQEQTVFVLKRLKWTGTEKSFPNNLGENIKEMCSYNEVSRCHVNYLFSITMGIDISDSTSSITISMDVIQHSSQQLSQDLCCLNKIKSAKLMTWLKN